MDKNWLCQRSILAARNANVNSRQALQLRHVQAHSQRIHLEQQALTSTTKYLPYYTTPYARTKRSCNKSKLKSHEHKHQYSSVGTVTRYRLDGPRFESRWGLDFPTHPDSTRCPNSLLYNGNRVSILGVNLPGRGVDHLPSSDAGAKHRKS